MSFEYLGTPALLTRQMIAAAMFAKADCKQILEVGGGQQSIVHFLRHPCHLTVVDPVFEKNCSGCLSCVEVEYIPSTIGRLDPNQTFDGMVHLGLDGRAPAETLVKWANNTKLALFECSKEHERSYLQLSSICRTIKLPLLWELVTHYDGAGLEDNKQFLYRIFVAFGTEN